MHDPGISPSTTNLDFRPTAPRWGGGRFGTDIPDTPARRRAIAERRRYLAAVKAGELDGFGDARQLEQPHTLSPFALAAAVPELGELELHALRVLAKLVAVQLAGFRGVCFAHVAIAEACGLSERTARRAMTTLVAFGHVLCVAPLFEEHGAASSRRGNAYTVAPTLLGQIARARVTWPNLAKHPERSEYRAPTFAVSSSPEVARKPPSGENADSPCLASPVDNSEVGSEPASPVKVSASPTVNFRTELPDAPTVTLLEARQAAICNAPPEAPEGRGLELLRSVWRELAASGDAFAAELFADDERRQRLRKRFGNGGAS